MHQFSLSGMIRVGVIVEGVFGLIAFGRGVGEIIMDEEPAQLNADVLLSEREVGQVADNIIAVLDAVGSARRSLGNSELIAPASPGGTKPSRNDLGSEGDEIG